MIDRARPKKWYRWDYDVLDGDAVVATTTISNWRERGGFEIDGRTARIRRESSWGDFVLTIDGSEKARATKTSAFTRKFVIRVGEYELTLEPESIWRRTMVLHRGEVPIGMIRPKAAYSRVAIVELPEILPAEVRLFVLWLTLLTWKRQAAAAAAGGG